MKPRHSGARGQVVPVVALFLIILTGFVGIVVDGGIGYTHKRHNQDVADAAALAGSHTLYTGGTLAQAQSAANEVATLDGCTGACSLQPLGWYDSGNTQLGGSPAPSSVARVGASVSDTETTSFANIGTSGSRSVSVPASAQALVNSSGTGSGAGNNLPCELCLMGNLAISAQNVNITSNVADLDVNGNFTISAKSSSVTASNGHLVKASGAVYSVNNNSTVSPAPQRTPPPAPFADPLAGVPTPDTTGLANKGNYTFPAGFSTATISPGIYGLIDTGVQSGVTLNLNPGVYEITGGLAVHNSSVTINGTGVILYFGCNGPLPVPTCAVGQAGAGLTVSTQNDVFNLSAPTSGTDNGIVFFWDRNNVNTFNISASSFGGQITGALYAAAGNITLTAQDVGTFASPIVANNLTISASGSTFNLNGNTLLNSSAPGGLIQ